MIMSIYNCEIFFLHDLVNKQSGLCTNNVLFISMFFMIPTCIHPMVAMVRCFVVSYPRLHGHLVMEDGIYTLLYHSHFGLHECKSDHASLNYVGLRILEMFWFPYLLQVWMWILLIHCTLIWYPFTPNVPWIPLLWCVIHRHTHSLLSTLAALNIHYPCAKFGSSFEDWRCIFFACALPLFLCCAMLVGRVVRNHSHLKRTLFSENPKVLRVKIHVGCIIDFTINNFVWVRHHTNLWVRIVMEDKGGSSAHENWASKGVVGSWGLCPLQWI